MAPAVCLFLQPVARAFRLGEQQWRLVLHPRGRGGRGRSLSLYLSAVGPTALTPFSCWQQPASFALSLVNARDAAASRVRSERHLFTPSEPQYGFTSFVPGDLLTNPEAGFLTPAGGFELRATLSLN